MVVIVPGQLGLPVISLAEAVKYQGFVNATHPLLLLVDVVAMEHRRNLAAVTTIRANVNNLSDLFSVVSLYLIKSSVLLCSLRFLS